jgi:hypothetical protein
MATLYVTEFATVGQAGSPPWGLENAPTQVGHWDGNIIEQTVAIAAGHAESAAFNARTTLIRVSTDAVCSIVIGTTPVAAATSARMAANTVEYFGVRPGDKISVITNT